MILRFFASDFSQEMPRIKTYEAEFTKWSQIVGLRKFYAEIFPIQTDAPAGK